MAKISGTVTFGETAIENAKIMLLEDTGLTFILIGITTSGVMGTYSFIHSTAVDIAKNYHIVCQYELAPNEYQALSFPYITPVASVDTDNFTPITTRDIGWNMETLPSTGFVEGTKDVPI